MRYCDLQKRHLTFISCCLGQAVYTTVAVAQPDKKLTNRILQERCSVLVQLYELGVLLVYTAKCNNVEREFFYDQQI